MNKKPEYTTFGTDDDYSERQQENIKELADRLLCDEDDFYDYRDKVESVKPYKTIEFTGVRIPNISNSKQFLNLLKELKKGHSSFYTQYSICEYGYNKYFEDAKKYRIPDILYSITIMNRYFSNEMIKKYPRLLLDGILDRDKGDNITLKVEGNKQLGRLSDDAELCGIKKGHMLLINYIYTFNEVFRDSAYAREYESYYSDNGYIQTIRYNMEKFSIDLSNHITSCKYHMETEILSEDNLVRQGRGNEKRLNKMKDIYNKHFDK